METTISNDYCKIIEDYRSKGLRIVFTNGCFDILHVGHLRYLTQAKSLGDRLVIGLNSDYSVKKIKGESRPIVCQEERKEMLLGLKPVDLVVVFDEDTPLRLIKEVSPDILVKGGDWTIDKIVGSDFVLAKGGKVMSVPYVQGKSSSAIIARL